MPIYEKDAYVAGPNSAGQTNSLCEPNATRGTFMYQFRMISMRRKESIGLFLRDSRRRDVFNWKMKTLICIILLCSLSGLKAADNFTREAQILGEALADAGYQTWRQTKTIPDKSIGTKAIWTVAKKFYAAPEQQEKFAATAIEFLNAQQNRLMLLPAQ
jgi:hypothetical protein